MKNELKENNFLTGFLTILTKEALCHFTAKASQNEKRKL